MNKSFEFFFSYRGRIKVVARDYDEAEEEVRNRLGDEGDSADIEFEEMEEIIAQLPPDVLQ